MQTFSFELFVSGRSIRSRRAIANLRSLCETLLANDCAVDIIDVLQQPELAEQRRILTTPTLIKGRPLPLRRVTGDLSDPQLVLDALAIEPIHPESV